MASFSTLLMQRATALVPTAATTGAARLDGPELLELITIIADGLDVLESISVGAQFRLEARAPLAADGANGDGWLNALTGDLFKKVAGVWEPRGNLKGPKGNDSTVPGPRGNDSTVAGPAGKSAYQLWLDAGNTGTVAVYLASLRGTDGEDGRAGSRITASTTAGAGGADGDLHFQTLSAERYRIHSNVAGTWQVLYTTPETVDLFGWPATEVAKITNPANWDVEGGYTGPLLVGISFPKFYGFKSQSPSIPSAIFMAAADNVVLRSVCF